jgi:hypothetical protein
MIKFKKTKRSFYGKWVYKVSLTLKGAWVLRYGDLDSVEKNIQSRINKFNPVSSVYVTLAANQQNIVEFADFLKKYPKTTYAFRVESDIIDIYTNDESLFDTLLSNNQLNIRSAARPDKTHTDILLNKKNIVVNKYPHNRYRYKVFLLPHKNLNRVEKTKYMNWLESLDGKVTVSSSIKSWFIRTDWNWDRRYLLVEDESTLLMMKLKHSEFLGSIYNYVLVDK